MHIDSGFSVVAPIGQVWNTLMDFERVAGCLPGAKILGKLSEDAYQVGMTVKLGPVTMQYRGLLNVVERDAGEHRAVLSGKAQETRGQGTAEATLTLALAEDGGTTSGTVSAELSLSGKAAAMGKGVIGSVTEQMMSLFASNLQAMLAQPASEAAAPAVTAAPAPETAPALPPSVPPGAGGEAPAAGSLDAVSLARGVAAEQLSHPGKVLGGMAVVACIAYFAGRRSAFRMLRLCGRI